MSELRQILDLWKRAWSAREEICLATIVGFEGSAYRRPGARMLLTSSGERAGTVSGGCLEAEITKKAWWLTEQGPSIQRYSSFFDDDGDMPYGLGCGGTVIVLLERGEAAAQNLEALRRSVEDRTASVILTNTGNGSPGTTLILSATGEILYGRNIDSDFSGLAREALRTGRPWQVGEFFVEMVAPPPALTVFGAGDDVQPLVEFAATMGWHVTVADGRSNLARPGRFPAAACVGDLESGLARMERAEAVVVMTHSYEQDRKILRALLAKDLRYLGVLGPRVRTERLAGEIAPEVGLTAIEGMARLHAPVGLDLGGHSPTSIALAIAAELQAVFAGREARMPAQPAVHV